jgi:nucleoid-associated protein YgaU
MVARRWLGLVVGGAALLGVAVGAGVVLRGRSLGPSAPSSAASRPTFVVGPSVSPQPLASPSPTVAATEYVVQPGDTLRSIASEKYGDPEQWPRVYDANRDVIGSDPDRLQTGSRLRLP